MTEKKYTDVDIQNAWQQLAKQKFSNSQIKKQEIMNAIHQESHSSIATLKRRLAGRVKVFLFGALMTGVMFFIFDPSMQYIMGVATLFQLILAALLHMNYRKMDAGLHSSSNVLEAMKNNLRLIKLSINMERINNLLMFPAFALVFWIGVQIENEAVLNLLQVENLQKLAIAVAVAFPLMMLYGEIYYRLWFGQHPKRLEENIIRMETLQ